LNSYNYTGWACGTNDTTNAPTVCPLAANAHRALDSVKSPIRDRMVSAATELLHWLNFIKSRLCEDIANAQPDFSIFQYREFFGLANNNNASGHRMNDPSQKLHFFYQI
jgi:hypothetical protein